MIQKESDTRVLCPNCKNNQIFEAWCRDDELILKCLECGFIRFTDMKRKFLTDFESRDSRSQCQ